MEQRLIEFLRRSLPDADEIVIQELTAIPGGFSRETYRFDALVRRADQHERLAFILRKDPPAAAALLHTSRAVEHDLIEAVRLHTSVLVGEGMVGRG